VVAIDDIEQSLALVDTCKAHFPQLQLVARARNVTHYYQLRARGGMGGQIAGLIQKRPMAGVLIAQAAIQLIAA
jgi:hypothetical protein